MVASFVASISPVLIWFLSGVVFLMLELMVPGFVVFFFGLGAWCAALALYLYPMAFGYQLLVFLVASLLLLALLRSTVKQVFLGRSSDKDAMDLSSLFQGTAEVVDDIVPPAIGSVKYSGTFWQAEADQPLVRGTVVRILAKNNLILKVTPIHSKQNS